MKLEPFRAEDTREQTQRKMQLANDAAEELVTAVNRGDADLAELWRAAFEAAGMDVNDGGVWTAEKSE